MKIAVPQRPRNKTAVSRKAKIATSNLSRSKGQSNPRHNPINIPHPVGTICTTNHNAGRMDPTTRKLLRIGDWTVDPASSQISRPIPGPIPDRSSAQTETARLEARTMLLLLCLADHAGQVVSIDDLLTHVWSGVIVTPDSVYQAVTSLRRQLGDDPKQPTYIATVPRLGYRMVANVSPWPPTPPPTPSTTEAATNPNPATKPSKKLPTSFLWTATAILVLALVAAGLGAAIITWVIHGKVSFHRSSSPITPTQPSLPQKSVAVIPFLDLTQGMKEEEFADGITEELIDKLTKIPGLRVPSATASFYFKDKQIPVADIAKNLGVAYILDGSVRKSGTWIRVDARLIRADNGYIVWSHTYDQPMKNILMVQDDIATAVAKALSTSIGAAPPAQPE
jgi:TolB-like protein/DNA-binding winged helix-turn-helix (wHTH) protein